MQQRSGGDERPTGVVVPRWMEPYGILSQAAQPSGLPGTLARPAELDLEPVPRFPIFGRWADGKYSGCLKSLCWGHGEAPARFRKESLLVPLRQQSRTVPPAWCCRVGKPDDVADVLPHGCVMASAARDAGHDAAVGVVPRPAAVWAFGRLAMFPNAITLG